MDRVCVIGAGVAGLGAAWALSQHPDRFDLRVFERADRLGGNAVTVEVPQADGSKIPVDISVTAFIPSVYPNYVALLRALGIRELSTRFSYSVDYDGQLYAHDFDSRLHDEFSGQIARFRRLQRRLDHFNVLNARPSLLLAALNPYNYISMGRMLERYGIGDEFRYKILKPLFVNLVLASNIFDMPASMFSRYLEFFDVEHASPMTTWEGGTREIYARLSAGFADRIELGREVSAVFRDRDGVIVQDAQGHEERFDHVVLACNANHALAALARPSLRERIVLGSVRYESSAHGDAIVHTDGSVLPDNATRPMTTRSTYVRHVGERPDDYEITYIMHNQQPWAKRSDRPCLVTYNSHRQIDESKVLARFRFQHVVHDIFHTVVLLNLFQFLQGRRRTYYCGAHTAVNSQEHAFISGVAVARQLGADHPAALTDDTARKWFNFSGRLAHGRRFHRVGR
ncbi:MAG: Amine oxidase [Frankiales bacterium]|nr:Amine oxidase [Frankiales bacterium]